MMTHSRNLSKNRVKIIMEANGVIKIIIIMKVNHGEIQIIIIKMILGKIQMMTIKIVIIILGKQIIVLTITILGMITIKIIIDHGIIIWILLFMMKIIIEVEGEEEAVEEDIKMMEEEVGEKFLIEIMIMTFLQITTKIIILMKMLKFLKINDILFVKGIGYDSIEDDIRGTFIKYGEISQIKILKDKETQIRKGSWFVKCNEIVSAVKALNDTDNLVCQGRNILVKFSKIKKGN